MLLLGCTKCVILLVDFPWLATQPRYVNNADASSTSRAPRPATAKNATEVAQAKQRWALWLCTSRKVLAVQKLHVIIGSSTQAQEHAPAPVRPELLCAE